MFFSLYHQTVKLSCRCSSLSHSFWQFPARPRGRPCPGSRMSAERQSCHPRAAPCVVGVSRRPSLELCWEGLQQFWETRSLDFLIPLALPELDYSKPGCLRACLQRGTDPGPRSQAHVGCPREESFPGSYLSSRTFSFPSIHLLQKNLLLQLYLFMFKQLFCFPPKARPERVFFFLWVIKWVYYCYPFCRNNSKESKLPD